MAENVTDLHTSHIKNLIKRLTELHDEEGMKMLSVTGVTGDGSIVNILAHDGDPEPYSLLGGIEEQKRGILDWMGDHE